MLYASHDSGAPALGPLAGELDRIGLCAGGIEGGDQGGA